MLQDMHIHSNYSDGANSIEDMVCCAISLGLRRICFTDHVWKTTDWIDDYIKELQRCNDLYGKSIEVLGGVETKILDYEGALDVNPDRYDSDLRIVAAMHRIPYDNGGFIRSSEIKNDIETSKKAWLYTLQGLQHNRHIDCIAHPFSLLEHMGITKDDKGWWETVSNVLERSPAKIEFNVKYDNSIVPSWFWKRHIDKIIPASDSHSVSELRERFNNLEIICRKLI